MKVKFLGAAGTVTGSSYLVTPESGRPILIDLGMFQGSEEIEKLNYAGLACDGSQIEGVVLTHAHLDHCGRLPIIFQAGFEGNIWSTPATLEIAELSLLDSAKIGKEDKSKPALYNKEQVLETVSKFKTVEYDTAFQIGSFDVIFKDAGHILGSACVVISDRSATGEIKKIVFSGDLGNTPEDLIKATEVIDGADAVVMESTYGDKVHRGENPSEIIQTEINAIEESGGALLIPAFSIERSQEILHRISHMKKNGKVKNETPVFLDSPMAEKTTVIFERYYQLFNDELKQDFSEGDPFNFPGLVILEHRNHGKVLEKVGGKVIIAGSGMMSGGRILNHAIQYLPLETTRLLIVGYQAEETLGRAILEGNKQVKIEGIDVEVKATITETQAMSSHADQPRLLNWLRQIKGVKRVILTHGETVQRNTLAEKIRADLEIQDVAIPGMNEEISL